MQDTPATPKHYRNRDDLYAALGPGADNAEIDAIYGEMAVTYGYDKRHKIYLRTLQDWEFDHWSDEERDIQYPGWRDW
jgi:hypothetical protein